MMIPNLVGSRLGKYEIRAEIGRGGMGTVYLGYDPLLDRKVAVKVLAPHLAWESDFVERFLREARSAARLRHPSIVTIYDVGHEGNWYFLVMEYLAGPTLAQLIARQGPMSSSRALPILRQLADALDYAHRQGLIHRDVKPGNVIISDEGQATLTDFGVARAAQETRLTATGSVVGTPRYMSPEQARGDALDHRSDLYSLGVVAYEMLTGQVPFTATTPHAVLHKLIYEAPPPVRSRRPDLPPAIEPVMARALAKAPESRYQTGRELVQALEQALAAPASAPPESRPAPPPTVTAAPVPTPAPAPPTAPPSARWVWLWWLLVSVLGWALGWIPGMALAEQIGHFIGPYTALAEIVGSLVQWGLLGLVLGTSQWLVLRRYLRGVGGWIVATGLALALLGSVKWLQGAVADTLLMPLNDALIGSGWEGIGFLFSVVLGMAMEGASGLVLGAAQALVIRRRVDWAGRWVGINALAWALVVPVVSLLTWFLGEPGGPEGLWLLPVISSAIFALITGLGLNRQLRRGTGGGK
ncbi:MAG TPA: serine/threonine protein kinase [Anaerolineae bacterium]|nr:serine/threonine protein kinase [Anaerolineae bacterium]